jgi:hypothetical protein
MSNQIPAPDPGVPAKKPKDTGSPGKVPQKIR